MNKSSTATRQKALKAAIGSIRAEGLEPSVKTKKQLKLYAEGKITIDRLRSSTIQVKYAVKK